MNLQINAITLAVKDLNRAKKFYAEGLGCTIDQDHPGFVSLKVGESPVKLGLYTREALATDAGVPAEQIEVAGVCTRCEADRFFSHRANDGQPAGRFAALIRIEA